MDHHLFSFRLQLLRDEISLIQDRIKTYDDLSFTIKGWAATLWSAILGFAISQKLSLLVLLAIPVLAAFWLLDAYFKSFQQRLMACMGYIESFLNGTAPEAKGKIEKAFEDRSFGSFIVYDPIGRQTLATDERFKARFVRKVDYKRCLMIRNIRSLYLALMALSIIACIFIWAGSGGPGGR